MSSRIRFAARSAGLGALILAAGLLAAALAAPPRLATYLPELRQLWFLSALAVALAVLGLCLWRGVGRFGLFAALILTGGAAQLFLTEPLWFPLPTLRPSGPWELAMVALIAVEALAALAVLIAVGPLKSCRNALASVGRLPLLLLASATVILSVSVMRHVHNSDWAGYALRLGTGGALTMVHLAALWALSLLRPPVAAIARLPGWVAPSLAFAASLIACWAGFERLPHVEDEYAYLFQAATYASGALHFPAPPEAALPGLVHYLLTVDAAGWYSVTAPGWPAILAIGTALGMPWIVNPLLFAVTVWFAQDMARRRIGDGFAAVFALLMATSPWLIASAASLMTHSLTLALTAFSWWAVTLADQRGRGRGVGLLLAAGLALGWVFTTRPLDGLLIGVLTGLWVALGPARSLLRTTAYSVGAVATGSVYLLYNRAMTGDPLLAPQDRYLSQVWHAGANDYGFGPNIGPPGGWGALDLRPGHTVLEGFINTANNLVSLQFEGFGWAAGSLILIFAALRWLAHDAFDRAMWAVFGTTVAVLFFYWFAGSFYIGPRYWFITALPFVWLSARGFAAMPGEGKHGVLPVLIVSALLVFLPWRAVTKYHEYGNVYAELREARATGQFGNAIVLVRSTGNPASALVLNQPDFPADAPIFLIDGSERGKLDEAAIRAALPGRPLMHYLPQWRRDPPEADVP
jgi:hypothetical protein